MPLERLGLPTHDLGHSKAWLGENAEAINSNLDAQEQEGGKYTR